MKEPTEFTEFLQNNISSSVEQRLKNFWDANNVEEKLQQLNDLKQNTGTKIK